MEDTQRAWWKDTAERMVWTFIQGATGWPLAVALGDATGWVDLGDPNMWESMIVGGTMAVLSFLKSLAATRLSQGGTAQMGAHTYSYTEAGPGAAGGDL